jgi:hypothetical protein
MDAAELRNIHMSDLPCQQLGCGDAVLSHPLGRHVEFLHSQVAPLTLNIVWSDSRVRCAEGKGKRFVDWVYLTPNVFLLVLRQKDVAQLMKYVHTF